MFKMSAAFNNHPTHMDGTTKHFRLQSPEGAIITFIYDYQNPDLVTIFGKTHDDTIPVFYAKCAYAQLVNEGWAIIN